jgi:hypothetical protein
MLRISRPLVADVERHDPSGGRAPIPPELRAQLQRLLARILVEDYLATYKDGATDIREWTDVP